MTANLVDLRTMEFSEKYQLLSQQYGSKLQPLVSGGSHTGKQASPVNQIGLLEMQEVVERFTKIERQDAPVDRPWVYPKAFDLPQMVDRFDELQALGDVKPSLVMTAVNAAGRKKDNIILQAAFATRNVGEAGAGTEAFGTVTTATAGGTNVAVGQGASAATNLTVSKLREVKRAFMADEVDIEVEEPTVVVNASGHDSLLAEAQIISTDFNSKDKPVLEDGKVRRFLGMNFVWCERVTSICVGTDDASGTSVGIPVFVKSGLYLGTWAEIETKITQREDLKLLPWQVYLSLMMGATRLEKKKVKRIWCRQ